MPKQTQITEIAAPGHVYLPQIGSGIEWLPETVRLWERGTLSMEAHHQTLSAYQFWHSLAFADCFPEITHWWFRSAWTQRVRLTRAQGMLGTDTIWGYMQFVDDQQPGQIWTVSEGDRPTIETPFPPHENQPVNLPLRLALARLVAGVLSDEVVPDHWMTVTSLVERDQLSLAFPTRLADLSFCLAGVQTSLREALCRLQGLVRL